MKENNLILASGSPRRRELLSLYTTDFTVCVSDFDESAVTAPTPAQLVEQLAIGKCLAVAKQHPDVPFGIRKDRLRSLRRGVYLHGSRFTFRGYSRTSGIYASLGAYG